MANPLKPEESNQGKSPDAHLTDIHPAGSVANQPPPKAPHLDAPPVVHPGVKKSTTYATPDPTVLGEPKMKVTTEEPEHSKILKAYGGLESNIPVNHPYWRIRP